uniref:Uncharacterized protein n=1 Tax=Candidatus Kentrum sp. FM TaxID=2126340 RepID=A0A450X5E3_9GAMM|nr:MAG: hypothetical protein BECKFM1743B_GA0114221_109991 [Candidatus Kentron sp. FM]
MDRFIVFAADSSGRILHLGEERNIHAILSTKGAEKEERFFNHRGHRDPSAENRNR